MEWSHINRATALADAAEALLRQDGREVTELLSMAGEVMEVWERQCWRRRYASFAEYDARYFHDLDTRLARLAYINRRYAGQGKPIPSEAWGEPTGPALFVEA